MNTLAEARHALAQPCIFAVATGAGRAAIAVLRLTGLTTGPVLDALCGQRPSPRLASLRRLRSRSGELLDQSLVLWMPAPNSYTGEDCAELHVHGGHAVIEAVAEALASAGARPAEPGEFSRRAFLNGRMDLLEAEAVADLVDAETASQRRQALRQMNGETGQLYRGWADQMLQLLATQETLVDFPDEDLPAALEDALLGQITTLEATLRDYLDDGHRGERLRDGVTVAITGAPNVGKSSLMNALCRRDVAIVSAEPGTTRDVVQARIVLRDVIVTLLDTAGLRAAEGAIEQEGVRRARQAASEADVVLQVVDPTQPNAMPDAPIADVVVSSKADLQAPIAPEALACSALTGQGMDLLRHRLGDAVGRLVRQDGPPPVTHARYRACLTEAMQHLQAAGNATLAELRAESLRLGHQAIGRITGAGDIDSLLDEVFGRFCIGK